MSAVQRYFARLFSFEDLAVTAGQSALFALGSVLLTALRRIPPELAWPTWAAVALVSFLVLGVVKAVRSMRPEITLKITGLSVAKGSANPDLNGTTVLVMVAVSNRGIATALDDWGIYATPPTGARREGHMWVHAGTIQMAPYTWHSDDLLHDKTLGHPVDRGRLVKGYLLANFEDIDYPTLSSAGIVYEVQCTDVFGNVHRGSVAKGSMPSVTDRPQRYLSGFGRATQFKDLGNRPVLSDPSRGADSDVEGDGQTHPSIE